MIIYAAADTKYFMEHGIEFINSCVANKNKCLVTIFRNFEEPPEQQDLKLHKFMEENSSKLHPNAKEYLIQPEYFTNMYDCNVIIPRAYYASFRFLHLPTIMREFFEEDFLVVDIDSIILTELPKIDSDVGMYLRLDNTIGANPYEIIGMKVAAGLFYLSKDSIEIADYIKASMIKENMLWFVDQHALYRTYVEIIKGSGLKVLDFKGTKWIDWDFVEDSFIWTAKGESRKKDPVYLTMKSKYGDGNGLESKIN